MRLSNGVVLPDREIEIHAIRAQGPGGQHVNKVSSAVHLRFDISASSLSSTYKDRLLNYADRRISTDGVINIKVQDSRSQDRNRTTAMQRLSNLIDLAMRRKKKRIASKPSRSAQRARMDAKTRRSRLKNLRGRVNNDD